MEAAVTEDSAWLARLLQVQATLRRGEAGEAFRQAGVLFSEGHAPPLRIGELCALTAEAAQSLGLSEVAEQMWPQAAAHATHPAAAADAWANLGALLASRQRTAEAEEADRHALQFAPDHAVALANLAVLLAETGRPEEAEACHRRVLERQPGNATTHSNLGVLLAALKRPEEAERHLRFALDLDPESASAHTNLGLLLQDQRRPQEAEAHQRRALAVAPGSAEIHSNLGNLLASLDRFAEAETLLRQALALDPDWATAHNNLGVLLADQLRDAEAEVHFRRALELRPGYPLARLDLSCLLLAQGRFEEGWRLHEARHDPALPDNGIPPPNLALPRWQGEPLAGRRLLVWPEQGLGDQIQFCRCVPRLKSAGAAFITLVCQRPLKALFDTLPGADAVLAADVVDNAFAIDPATLAEHDFWTFPLSAPALLGTDLSTLPEVAMPYLTAPADRADTWRARLPAASGAVRVGLAWRGNPLHHNDADRSMPGLQTLAPLWSVPGVRFVSLQFGSAGLVAREAPADQPLIHLGDQLADFADTAGALAALDLLVCVDTSIAHLAGAMATPCWVLLPAHRTDWRWLRGRDDSPWYPIGMRLFRQAERGAWGPVVERVRDALLVFTRARAA
jgi:Flp pilus assembly protein TadD